MNPLWAYNITITKQSQQILHSVYDVWESMYQFLSNIYYSYNFFSEAQWPLLLTWFNFNPSMNK